MGKIMDKGLGWFDAEVIRLNPQEKILRVPHVGWNDISFKKRSILVEGLPAQCDVYFTHSYHMVCHKKEDIVATCQYGGNVVSAIEKNNIFAMQFHPEKSQDNGLRILENFMHWKS